MSTHTVYVNHFFVTVFLAQVNVAPAPSSDYTLTPLSGDQYTSCLCANERKTVSWTMSPSVLGKGQTFIIESLSVLSHITEVIAFLEIKL